ncbi:hypothetical protein K0M31_003011 [Melipona bicolor]|uniref:Uncharacterized protein n=1 Tax=Melipona bicolor TaxID=60889 RepID=A0AA40G0C3_9HYME|nr:hypothetical protein K0M31_003011 [Melipona bicolor]
MEKSVGGRGGGKTKGKEKEEEGWDDSVMHKGRNISATDLLAGVVAFFTRAEKWATDDDSADGLVTLSSSANTG